MIGAIIGDIVGSVYEFNNHRSKEFPLFRDDCFFTDDTVMTLAVGKAIIDYKKGRCANLSATTVKYMQEIGQHYPDCGYGGRFYGWIYSKDPQPYDSYGNGAAMRVSAAGFAAQGKVENKYLSDMVTLVSHNHPEGLKGAEAVARSIYMARNGASMEEIRQVMQEQYYDLNFTLDSIRSTYRFNETCQDTVPQAIKAFLESASFEDAIRNAISIGGDSDTLAAITGSIAEAYYGVPKQLEEKALSYLDDRLLALYNECREYNNIID